MRKLRVVLIVLFLSVFVQAAEPNITIDESDFRATIADNDITVTIPIVSSFPGSPAAQLTVELLDTDNRVLATADVDQPLKPGSNLRSVSLTKPRPTKFNTDEESVWYRIRYSLVVTADRQSKGIVALGAITPGLFQFTAAYPGYVVPGSTLQMRVHAANPVTHRAVPGVRLTATPDFDAADHPTSLTATTNSAGDAVFRLQIPSTITDEFSIKVEGRFGGFTRSSEFDVRPDSRSRIVINTDKLLYQPGQSLHARVMAFGQDRHALANASGAFTLRDPDDQILFQSEAKTNAFGIASVDWELPDSIALGQYRLEFEITDREDYKTVSSVRVSRYDLPNFTVTAKPDRTYYLPGQNAHVEVDARYLFGKDLARGSAKLVFRRERHWDYKRRDYVSDKEETQTTELIHGRATFDVDLSAPQQEFKSDDYVRFRDLDYSAYVTDPTTGKTEQRRFKIRLSHMPIHIYVVDSTIIDGRFFFYLSAYYPDGTPAECSIGIRQDASTIDSESAQLLRTVRTNRYGIAKVTHLNSVDFDSGDRNQELHFSARDKQGRTGTHDETISSRHNNTVIVSTDKALYLPTDPITVTVDSSAGSDRLIVEAFHDGAVIWSGQIGIRDHRGFTTIPANLGLTGDLVIAAYSLQSGGRNEYDEAVYRHVLFPAPTKLNLKLKIDRDTYRPGDNVTASLNVRLPNSGAAPSALGVVVVDKAVEERIRTDEEFGSGKYGFWDWSWWDQSVSAGGITRDDLNQLDLSLPLPDGLDLAAELILTEDYGWQAPLRISADNDLDVLERHFRNTLYNSVSNLRRVVPSNGQDTPAFPTTLADLDSLLRKEKTSVDSLLDPWGQPFRYIFGTEYRDRYIRISSAGPDKRFDTSDDLAADTIRFEYFSPIGVLINRVIKDAYAKSNSYIADTDFLESALLAHHVDLPNLRDPWGRPYSFAFGISGSHFELNVTTHGSDPKNTPFSVWTSHIDYFADARQSLDAVLARYSFATGKFPQSDAELDEALKRDNNNLRSLLDPWGNPYYVRYYIAANYSDFSIFTYDPDKTEQTLTPVTARTAYIEVWSNGPDAKPHTDDDFSLATYSRILSQQSGKNLVPQPANSQPNSGNSGAIQGVITDQSGAVVVGAVVTATLTETSAEQSVTSGSDGKYLFRNLLPGVYEIKVEARVFRRSIVNSVPVHSSSITQVDVTLTVGTSSEMVEVSAGVVELNTSSSSVAAKSPLSGTKVQIKEETFTPRVRDFFPETLYWAPSVITDANGHAKLNFKLADNITTWKMSVIASTKDGQIGAADTEIQSFQPFFAELDPPKILTVGDFIELPVVVRNYLSSSQQVGVEMKPAPWFELQKPGNQQITIPAGDSTNAIFPFRAIAAVKNGKQQVSAANRELGDAIEKPVSVHPDGLEQSATVTDLARGSQQLQLTLPANVIPGSVEGQLKIYPNLISHVAESIEAGLHRPYGCGEQTLSSTYPSLMLLQFEKTTGLKTGSSAKATHYLDLGLRRLISYRANSGGFNYWGRGDEADLALTAYAIRFLNDASQITNVNPDLISGAVKWLVSQQKPDGSWKPRYSYANDDNSSLTAYIALSVSTAPTSKDAAIAKSTSDSVQHAFQYLADPHRPMVEPYALAEFALLADRISQREQAASTLAKLRTLGIAENKGTYWSLEHNTPFYAWGHTGRIESTAMALLALATLDPHPSTDNRRLLDSATLYLLQQKDRYGVWYSGQATINVLKALLASLGSESKVPASTLTLTVNGRPSGTVSFAPTQFAPSLVDISSLLHTGNNEVSITGSASVSTAQAVATYYVPWTTADSVVEKLRTGKSDALRLSVRYDRTDANIGDPIKCTVSAERIGSRGWGMMIAEIGLPPGADVDRDSLNKVIANSGWTISHYDVLPDRLQLYLWPQAGGSNLEFTFRLRFGIQARTAPSQLYDYYNPEAEVALAPTDFHVTPTPH